MVPVFSSMNNTPVIWSDREQAYVSKGRGLARDLFNSSSAPSIGQEFVSSPAFTERGGETGARRSISVACRGSVLRTRTGFNSSDLAAVNVSPQQGFVALGVQRPMIQDLISPGTTGAVAIVYPRESTFTPGAEMVGERGIKPTWDPDITSETAFVKKVAVITKVPDEFLADFEGLASFIDSRLPYMVSVKTEEQLLYGDGLGNNLMGIASTAGLLTRTFDETWADTIMKAATDVHVDSFFEPDGIAIHPFDWEVARLEKDANGQPLAGGPTHAPYGNGPYRTPVSLWGLPAIVTTAVKVGRPIVGAWRMGAQYFVREGVHIEATNSNEDDFIRNMVSIRCEARLTLATYRPQCFCEIINGPARS